MIFSKRIFFFCALGLSFLIISPLFCGHFIQKVYQPYLKQNQYLKLVSYQRGIFKSVIDYKMALAPLANEIFYRETLYHGPFFLGFYPKPFFRFGLGYAKTTLNLPELKDKNLTLEIESFESHPQKLSIETFIGFRNYLQSRIHLKKLNLRFTTPNQTDPLVSIHFKNPSFVCDLIQKADLNIKTNLRVEQFSFNRLALQHPIQLNATLKNLDPKLLKLLKNPSENPKKFSDQHDLEIHAFLQKNPNDLQEGIRFSGKSNRREKISGKQILLLNDFSGNLKLKQRDLAALFSECLSLKSTLAKNILMKRAMAGINLLKKEQVLIERPPFLEATFQIRADKETLNHRQWLESHTVLLNSLWDNLLANPRDLPIDHIEQALDKHVLEEKLRLFAKQNNHKGLKTLIEQGVNLRAQNAHGESAVHIAVQAGNLSVLKMLAKHGADLNQQDKEGRCPLYWAANHGHIEIIEYLLSQDIDLQAKNTSSDLSPYLRAQKNHYFEAANLIAEALEAKGFCVK